MEISGKRIQLEQGTRGKIVVIIHKPSMPFYSDWILLLANVIQDIDNNGKPYLLMNRYVSYKIIYGIGEVSKLPVRFGKVENYDIYEPTDEQIEIIKNILRRNKLKYVRGINSIVDR
jgi:hypothetical protein